MRDDLLDTVGDTLGEALRNLADWYEANGYPYTLLREGSRMVERIEAERDAALAHEARLRKALTAVLASPEELVLPATGERAIFVTKEAEAMARKALEDCDG